MVIAVIVNRQQKPLGVGVLHQQILVGYEVQMLQEHEELMEVAQRRALQGEPPELRSKLKRTRRDQGDDERETEQWSSPGAPPEHHVGHYASGNRLLDKPALLYTGSQRWFMLVRASLCHHIHQRAASFEGGSLSLSDTEPSNGTTFIAGT